MEKHITIELQDVKKLQIINYVGGGSCDGH